jgi:hypothetical protein
MSNFTSKDNGIAGGSVKGFGDGKSIETFAA